MIQQNVELIIKVSQEKIKMLDTNLIKYFILSMMAGIYVGFGIILIFSVGGQIKSISPAFVKIAMGASFAIALILVIFAGSELFTGNNMVMVIGSLAKKVPWHKTLKLWGVCYMGNLAGSLLLALAMYYSGLITKGTTHDIILSISGAKMTTPFIELMIRGVLCNMLVCLAVWTSMATKNESARLGLIFWCLFAFIGSGFEHSVANMTLLGMGALVSNGLNDVSWLGYFNNLLPVTLGNMIGGGIFIGAAYWFVAQHNDN